MVAHLSKAVGKDGTVVAIDAEAAMVDYLTKRGADLGPARIVPRQVVRPIMDVMEGARSEPGEARGKAGRGKTRQVAEPAAEYVVMDPAKAAARIHELEQRMYQHARDLEFEDAARIRDQIRKLKEASLG